LTEQPLEDVPGKREARVLFGFENGTMIALTAFYPDCRAGRQFKGTRERRLQ
jgi:hypothetical protein